MEELKNLDDVERYLKEYAPDWRIYRGCRTDMHWNNHADEYEVIQVYRPGEFRHAYAEFWRGYYYFSPDTFTGFSGANGYGHFCIIGGLNFTMQDIMHENMRLKLAPEVLDVVMKTIEQDKFLGKIVSSVNMSNLYSITDDSRRWSVRCNGFKLDARTRCVMSVVISNDGREMVVNYSIQEKNLDDFYIDVKNEKYTYPVVS